VSLSTFLGMAFVVLLISAVLLVIFGQVTMRKLRKNSETKNELGVEFVSGWDIFNVAQALSLPKVVARKIRANPTGMLHANSDLLYKHTTIFDRLLARVFYALYVLSGSTMLILMILNWFGIFD